ncbi:MAG TPA: aspartate kinase, partial [Steroidobacteraceae bacterium]|nr:aspartate kinase [Steroidobacteraceae bacterium]
MSQWVVHKFGGSSVADEGCFRRVADIVEATGREREAVVLSACKGVTDGLLELIALAERADGDYAHALGALEARHTGLARALLSRPAADTYVEELRRSAADIAGMLHTVRLIRSAPSALRDVIAGYGEIWSTRLFAPWLRERGRIAGEVRWLDAREVVVVEWGPLGPAVDWGESERRIAAAVPADFRGRLVVTGFIATTRGGVPTTLGRNGSDFSGSIFGALLRAAEIHIWTDVDGVLSADPRLVPNAQVIDQLSYNEAMELAYFGAKVIHPQTMEPAVARDIPIYIRNTFAPEKRGTVICAKPRSTLVVKGITSIDPVALVNLEGAGMIGVPGTANRL